MEEDTSRKNRFILNFDDEEEIKEESSDEVEKQDDDDFFQDFEQKEAEIKKEIEERKETQKEEIEEVANVDNFTVSNNIQNMINSILKIDNLPPVLVEIEHPKTEEELAKEKAAKESAEIRKERMILQGEIDDILNAEIKEASFKSTVLDDLARSIPDLNNTILVRYGEDFTGKDYVTNPAIGRDNEIKDLVLTLLTPEKSAILTGKPGIGKTAIVEGLSFRIERDMVPDALKGYSIISVKTPSLLGTLSNGESKVQQLVNELKEMDKVILFIDEIHMLINATNSSGLDFANMFKEGLGRGQIKIIGATTTDEYERYILRDKAFMRRFQRIDVSEPNVRDTIKILMGTVPKIEAETGRKLKYTSFIQGEIMDFLVNITSEFKRVYGISSRYPDICLTLLRQAFSQAIFQNRKEVNIFDFRNAISNSTNIYPDVIKKELINFDKRFKSTIEEENNTKDTL